MALNLDKIKSKLNALTKKETSSSEFIWKPKQGQQIIRIVPYKFAPDDPFIELRFHYGLAGKTYLSPATFDRPDPVVVLANKLINAGNKESWIEGKQIEPKTRTFVPVIVRGEEELGVRYWGFGKTVYTELVKIMADDDYGDITDPMSGRDVVVEVLTAKQTGKNYPTTTIRVKPNKSPAVDPKNSELVKKLGEQVNITEIFKEPTFDELKEALENHLNPNAGNSDVDSIGSEYGDSTESSETSTTVNTSASQSSQSNQSDEDDDVDPENAFNELFNQ